LNFRKPLVRIEIYLLFTPRDKMADHGPGLPKNVRKAVSKVTEKLFVDHNSFSRHHISKDVRRGIF